MITNVINCLSLIKSDYRPSVWMEERGESFAQSPKHKAVGRRSPGIILDITVLFLSTEQLKASLIVRQNKVTVVAVVKKKKKPSKLK